MSKKLTLGKLKKFDEKIEGIYYGENWDETPNFPPKKFKEEDEICQQTILFVDGGCSKSNQKSIEDRIMIWVVTDSTGKVLIKKLRKGGSNNIAEFLAIEEALKYCVDNDIKNVVIYSDSFCAISWFYKKFDEEKFLNKKINNAREVLNIKKNIDSLLSKCAGNIIIEQLPREKNLAGHYIENNYGL